MKDEIVEEIHQIRRRLYEESQTMTPEEWSRKVREDSNWVREQVALRRAQKEMDDAAAQTPQAVR